MPMYPWIDHDEGYSVFRNLERRAMNALCAGGASGQ